MLAIRFATAGAQGSTLPEPNFFNLGASSLELESASQGESRHSAELPRLNSVESYSCKVIAKTPVESHSLQKNRGVPYNGALCVPFSAASRSKSCRIQSYRKSAAKLARRLARALLLSVCTIAAALLLAASASAQVSAAVSGHAEDASGAAVGGATVTVKSLETGATRSATTDDAGDYRVLSVPLGPLELTVQKTGFRSAVRTGINLVVGEEAVVNVRLEVGE